MSLVQQRSVSPKSCHDDTTWLFLWARTLQTSITEILAWALCLKSNTDFLGSFSMLGLSQVVGTEASSNLIAYDVFACFAKTAVVQIVVFSVLHVRLVRGQLIITVRKGLRPKTCSYTLLTSTPWTRHTLDLRIPKFCPVTTVCARIKSVSTLSRNYRHTSFLMQTFQFFCAPFVFQVMLQRTGAPPL